MNQTTTPLLFPQNELHPKRLRKAIKIIQEKKKITSAEYALLLEVSSATATRDLKKLLENGAILAFKKGRTRYYEIAKR